MQSLPTTLADLRSRLHAGDSFKYVLFWGHRPNTDGSIGKSCLSQWWPASFSVGGRDYLSAEHFMMAEKARLFGDVDIEQQILQAKTAAHAKKLGRRVRGFSQDVWEAERFRIVEQASIEKFGQNPELKTYLAATSSRVLVEASPQDAVWGIGLAAQDPRAHNPTEWLGLNLLGFALMAARAHLE